MARTGVPQAKEDRSGSCGAGSCLLLLAALLPYFSKRFRPVALRPILSNGLLLTTKSSTFRFGRFTEKLYRKRQLLVVIRAAT